MIPPTYEEQTARLQAIGALYSMALYRQAIGPQLEQAIVEILRSSSPSAPELTPGQDALVTDPAPLSP